MDEDPLEWRFQSQFSFDMAIGFVESRSSESRAEYQFYLVKKLLRYIWLSNWNNGSCDIDAVVYAFEAIFFGPFKKMHFERLLCIKFVIRSRLKRFKWQGN